MTFEALGLQVALGVQLADLMAGTLGGVCNVFLFRRQGVAAIAGAIIVGAITGGYLGAWLGKLLHVEPTTVISLVVGFSGGAVLKALAAQLVKRFPNTFNNGATNGAQQ